MLTPASNDIAIGNNQYLPAQQSQGGAYYLDPSLTAYVNRVGQKLAAVSDQPDLPYEFVILNNSVPNAWALPSGKIAINRGLLTKLDNEAQLAAVISHEIVHAAARHGAQRMRDNLLMQVGLAGLGLTLADNDYRSLIIGGATLGASLTTAKYGRDHELESDHYGMQYMAKAGYDLQGAIELQKLFVKMSEGQKSDWIQGLFASHPPSQERVNKNIQTAQQLQTKAGFQGAKEYQQAIAYMASKQKAYQHADKAAKELYEKQIKTALSEIEQAIAIEPKEALFFSLKGEILQQQDKSKEALLAHNKAMELNPKQFSYYLKRAETQHELGRLKAAESDLNKSMQLLPTSIAALKLGQIAQTTGQIKQAIAYFQKAASASGEIGEQAKLSLAHLEIQNNPNKYLKVNHIQDPKGPLLVFIENNSPLDIKGLHLTSELYNAKGEMIKAQKWQINELITRHKRSRYFTVPVVYHLESNQQIKTYVTQVEQ